MRTSRLAIWLTVSQAEDKVSVQCTCHAIRHMGITAGRKLGCPGRSAIKAFNHLFSKFFPERDRGMCTISTTPLPQQLPRLHQFLNRARSGQ
jgi:hypothetical protein